MPHESSIGVVIRLYAENQPPEWPGSAKFLVGVLIVILVILVTNENKVNPRFCLRLLLGFDNRFCLRLLLGFDKSLTLKA